MGIGSFFGTGGLIIGLGIGLVFVGGSYWFSDTLAVKAAGAQPVTEQEAPELYAIVRDLAAARRHADAAHLHLARGAAQRVRHRPRPEPGGRRRHPGPAPGPRPGRAARRARPRAEPREEPRHPHRLGRRRARDGHHLHRPHGDVGRDVHRRRRRPRQRQHLRRARDGDPRPDRGGADPDGAQPLPRVRGRPHRRRAARRRRAAGPGAREDRRLRQAGADERRPRPGDGLHHQPAAAAAR